VIKNVFGAQCQPVAESDDVNDGRR